MKYQGYAHTKEEALAIEGLTNSQRLRIKRARKDVFYIDEYFNVDCINCHYCTNCINCTNCNDCYDCAYCNYCNGCDYCINCNYCNGKEG